MKNLPIEMLRSFVVINEEGGFTAAADKLGRTQPAISQQLKKLEQLLDRSLMDRDSPKLELTPAGESLLTYARQILSLNDEAVGYFSSPPVSGRIRFGIPSEFAITLLPKIVSRFAKAYPDVTLEVNCDLSRNLLSDDQRNEYDLILALHDKVSAQQRRSIKNYIKTDELVWVSSASSRAHSQETLPLVAAPSGCIYRQRALRVLGKAKRSCRIVYTIPDLTGIQAAIDEGLGVTVLARSTVPDSLAIIEQSKHLPVLGTVGISLKQMDNTNNRAVKVLAEFIKSGLL
ncbi:LysR substrate-binding domain-containing protein [Oceanicoccus sagamiensis]|uniref:LysR family transcriptional regulator n=1 Tax=Oceanicoccus sagamiensis TaxID=716816 RepID=A0A1X9N6Y2_9GAMM|nr:LysR family transcriptional regulator [Oceanicoccus sagamiensis]ARN72914.1 LysR family transcriptional regulator [Oceanicoccus sagamiensis]